VQESYTLTDKAERNKQARGVLPPFLRHLTRKRSDTPRKRSGHACVRWFVCSHTSSRTRLARRSSTFSGPLDTIIDMKRIFICPAVIHWPARGAARRRTAPRATGSTDLMCIFNVRAGSAATLLDEDHQFARVSTLLRTVCANSADRMEAK